MKLEHHSDRELSVIDPAFHGKGVSGQESKRKRTDPEFVNRSYHYVSGTTPEASMAKLPFVHHSEVDDAKIYDFAGDPQNLKAKSMWGNSLNHSAYEKNIKDAGYHGYINRSHDSMGDAVALFHPIKPSHVMRKSMDLAKGKNAKEQKRKVFGSDPNGPRISEKRMKMMQAIKAYVKNKHGLNLEVASGKRDEEGNLREEKDITGQPFDVLTPAGHKAERSRQKAIDMANEAKAAVGEKGTKRVDPKPDWRSGNFETQPSPDAAIHELGHLVNEPAGQDLAAMQTRMDDEWGESQSKYGHMQQKKTAGEIQPMSLENPLRRRIGLPSTSPSKNPRPLSEHDRPVEQAVDGSGPRFTRGVKPGKNPQSVDYDRSSALMSPQNKEKLDQIDRGEVVFHPEKGWMPGTSVNAKINQRARAAANDPNPDTYFKRKDKDTLMRSEKPYNEQVEEKATEIKQRHKLPTEPTLVQKIKAIKDKYAVKMHKGDPNIAGGVATSPSAGAAMSGAFSGSTGMSGIGKAVGNLFGKSNAPHAPESPQDKAHDVAEGQPLQSALSEVHGKGKAMLQHLRNLTPRSAANRAVGADVPGVVGKSWKVPGEVPLQKDDAYGKKVLGSLSGKMFHNDAGHPDHAAFDKLDHMRASTIHTKMAGEAEARKQYPESAHHRKQAHIHRLSWKNMTSASPFIKTDTMQSKAVPPPTTPITANVQETLVPLNKEKKIEIIPHPEEVIDVEPHVIHSMKARLGSGATANTHRMLAAVKKLTSGERPMSGPAGHDPEFSAKLSGVMKKDNQTAFISQQRDLISDSKPPAPNPSVRVNINYKIPKLKAPKV